MIFGTLNKLNAKDSSCNAKDSSCNVNYLYFLIDRVAVLANTYQDMTVSLPPLTPALEGRRELAASQLQSLGYHVITVSPQL